MEFRNVFTRCGLLMADTIYTVKQDGFRCVEVIAPVARMNKNAKVFVSLGIKDGDRQAKFFGVNEMTIDLDPVIAAPEEIWKALEAWYEEVTAADAPTENERVAEGF